MAVAETGAPVNETTGATAQIVDAVSFSSVAATSSTAVTAGSIQTITVTVTVGTIAKGMWLTFDTGLATETSQVTTVSGTSVSAFFANAHIGTYAIVANINRQVVSFGSPSVQGQIAEVDSNNRMTTIQSRPTNTATTNVSASASSATLVAARTSPPRLSLTVYNSSANVNAYIAENKAAAISAGNYSYLIPPGGTLELIESVYTGLYNYISDSADGSYLNITERW